MTSMTCINELGAGLIRRVRRWTGILICWCICLSLPTASADSTPTGPPASERQSSQLPSGASLFDRLFARQTATGITYDVPYPFERLMETLRDRLPMAQQGQSPFLTVLIPLGRSLHRGAAQPEFFRYPRIVVAVDSQAHGRFPTRDRLFLGYQEKAEQIEVISYNEEAGRFEFQVVTGYGAGEKAVVNDAPRALCVSCHQNGGAVFPLSPWSETNSNARVAKRIRVHHHTDYHGVSTDGVSGDAGLFDTSTNRANLLSIYQRVWREGCESPDDPAASLRCRADAFSAMLRFRLGVWPKGTPNATEPHAIYRGVVGDNWRLRWPAGLAVPDADLPDRLPPLQSPTADIPPRFDPLRLRPPRTHWTVESTMDRVIEGLADGFLLKADIDRLDGELRERYRSSDHATFEITGECDVSRTSDGSDGARWFKILCTQSTGAGGGPDLAGELVTTRDGQVRNGLSWLYVTDRERAVHVDLSGSLELTSSGNNLAHLSLFKRYDTIQARRWDGAVMSEIEFEWDPSSSHGRFALTLVHDLDSIAEAINALLHDAEAGSFDGFDYGAVRGVVLMDALFDKLGIEHPEPAALRLTRIRNSLVEQESDTAEMASVNSSTTPVELFQRHCGTCHGSISRSPPGFLAGDTSQVLANLRSCAERISFRLAMWQVPAGARSKSPMPPPAYLDSASIDTAQWAGSADYYALRNHIDAMRAPANENPLSMDYSGLRPCLP